MSPGGDISLSVTTSAGIVQVNDKTGMLVSELPEGTETLDKLIKQGEITREEAAEVMKLVRLQAHTIRQLTEGQDGVGIVIDDVKPGNDALRVERDARGRVTEIAPEITLSDVDYAHYGGDPNIPVDLGIVRGEWLFDRAEAAKRGENVKTWSQNNPPPNTVFLGPWLGMPENAPLRERIEQDQAHQKK